MHGDASVDDGAVSGVAQLAIFVFHVRVRFVGWVKSSVVALADDDDGDFRWC